MATQAGNNNDPLGKYDIGNYTYPSDLMSGDGRYGYNYVVFYINVSSDSKLLKEPGVATVSDAVTGQAGEIRNLSAGQLTTATGVLGAGGVLAGSLLGLGGASATVAAASTVGVGVATGVTSDPSKTRSVKRLKTAIAMHVPNQLQIRYGVQYSEEDTFTLQAAAAGGEEIMKAVGDNPKSDVKGVGAAIISNIALSKSGGISAATGLAANPKKEQVFKGVDFRTFSFEYNFFPRDATEAANVLKIIQEFKYHMHPEFKDTNNFVYIYPSEFDILYYQGTQENVSIHKHTSCVLTELSLNYTPNGTFTTFANGMPTQINMTMTFRELALLTKETVKAGL